TSRSASAARPSIRSPRCRNPHVVGSSRMAGKGLGVAVCALVATLLAAASPAARKADYAGIALNILPPGESGNGGVHATDQAKLYDALTKLRGNVTAKTLRRDFKPETLGPTGKTKVESVPRA